MWQALFILTNAIALFGWFLLVAFPRKPLTHSAILYLGVALLCLIYAVCFGLVFGKVIDPGLPAGSSVQPIDFTSITGIRALFQSDSGIVIGWTHYLAFDLFTGMWIARDADAKQFSRLFQLPFLVLTFLIGPVGLFAWLVTRERRARLTGRG
jgi:Domain of unknown function (DUF4281)